MSLRLAFANHSRTPQPNHNFQTVQEGSICGACGACGALEKAARKYLRRAHRSVLRLVITVCVSRRRRSVYTYLPILAKVYDSGVVPLLLLFVIFAVRAPNWIYTMSAADSSHVREFDIRHASSRTPPCTCPTATRDI
jgi:hypothetical protein